MRGRAPRPRSLTGMVGRAVPSAPCHVNVRPRSGQAAAACRSCHSVSSLQTSLRLSRLDKKQTSVSPASAFVIGCGQGLSYGAESYAPHSWHSAHSAAGWVLDELWRCCGALLGARAPRPCRRMFFVFHQNGTPCVSTPLRRCASCHTCVSARLTRTVPRPRRSARSSGRVTPVRSTIAERECFMSSPAKHRLLATASSPLGARHLPACL